VIDLRSEVGRGQFFDLVAQADVLLEGHRPGVMERLGIGPDVVLQTNPRLVYGRMTGWGQSGPYAGQAGHDINYIGIAGALHPTGYRDRPPLPALNLVGDYGGGSMLLVVGVLSALLERERSGQGQVIDAAMVDGAALLMAPTLNLLSQGLWSREREANILDGGAHFYSVYETADGRFITVGAIEPQFYQSLLDLLQLDSSSWPQMDRALWPELRAAMATIFRSRPLAEWTAVFAGSDACVFAARSFEDVAADPQISARRTLVDELGAVQPAPAPRFSRTPGAIQGPPPAVGQHNRELLGTDSDG
jgi:alpha-methylacyl-CoA racemase